ncbi:MAG: nuclear transport factor 2 family protein [Solirubrobacterales bacterium]
MAAEENLAAVRRIYDEVGDLSDSARELYSPDYVMDVSAVTPDIGVLKGWEVANAAAETYFQTFDDFRIEIEEVLYTDDTHVVTAVRDGGRMKGSDAEIHNRFFHVWTFRDGKVVRFSSHLERRDALDAAGLSAP